MASWKGWDGGAETVVCTAARGGSRARSGCGDLEAAEKLRYALEFFADLFPGKRTDKQQNRFSTRSSACRTGRRAHRHRGARKAQWAPAVLARLPRGFRGGVLSGREDARVDAATAAASKALLRVPRLRALLAMSPLSPPASVSCMIHTRRRSTTKVVGLNAAERAKIGIDWD
jgi:hypothetical protein